MQHTLIWKQNNPTNKQFHSRRLHNNFCKQKVTDHIGPTFKTHNLGNKTLKLPESEHLLEPSDEMEPS